MLAVIIQFWRHVLQETLDSSTEMCYTDSVRSVGVDDGEVPPVPIPNTEVKLIRVESTWRETAREDRSTPASFTTDLYIEVCCSLSQTEKICFS